uniref:ATP-dependent Clp protease ATP-binding subunit ClpX n=1 Tax=Talaromyces marneffei PM1 TaxID=1077442 RepID=A0A093V388_TALMA
MSASTSRKRKSPEPERDAFNQDQVTTPSSSPARKKLKISQRQKQALIDNLQLEITERARRLRAQYALQAQDLRSRIERRHWSSSTIPKKSAVPSKAMKSPVATKKQKDVEYPILSATKSPSRRPKQTSNVGSYSDKENAPVPEAHVPLENPKKRGNPAASGQPRSVSQVLRDAETKVLSPKSSNSRTYKQSPLIASPSKATYMSRPTSPLKPASPLKAMIEDARARATRPEAKAASPTPSIRRTKTTAQIKRTTVKPSSSAIPKSPAGNPSRQHNRNMSTSTTSSNMSTSTTIVKPTRGTQRPTATTSSAAAKRATLNRSQGPSAATAAAAKRTAVAAKKAGADAATTGRVLRRRAQV